MKVSSPSFARACGTAILTFFLLLGARIAYANVDWYAAYDFATSNAEGKFFSGGGCQLGTCSLLPLPGTSGQVNSSDWAVAQEDKI
jgi:hypothetical protein